MWLDHVGERWRQATRTDVEEWLDGRELGARARYTSISHLHCFYEWANREELTFIDPTRAIERPRLPRRLPRPGRVDVIDRMIDSAPADMRAILCLMVDGGLRCCEVARLDWSDVDLEVGTIHVVGKGGHERIVGIPQRLRLALFVVDAGSGPVTGRELRPARVSRIVNAYMRSVGLTITAHQLRHTYGTRLYRATGGNLLAVQQALGHASVTSTQIYALVDPDVALAAARAL